MIKLINKNNIDDYNNNNNNNKDWAYDNNCNDDCLS